ncbi:hypothetical protein FCV25MIE_20349 [Fagus crenata]
MGGASLAGLQDHLKLARKPPSPPAKLSCTGKTAIPFRLSRTTTPSPSRLSRPTPPGFSLGDPLRSKTCSLGLIHLRGSCLSLAWTRSSRSRTRMRKSERHCVTLLRLTPP